LSIFGDHSDVMATRQTGWALLASGSIQETMDLALVAHAATLEARLPFLHFFDGFRSSHEIQKIEELSFDDLRHMIDEELVTAHRARALSPDHPVMRGTAQNPDVYFQGRERANPFYDACPAIVQKAMDKFAALTGRQYHLFDYVGAPDAERVVVMMGSGAEVAHEAVEHLVAQGEKVGLLKVRLYRPFSIASFVQALPASVKAIAVLDRTKESGSAGEPLYADVQTAIVESLTEGSAPFSAMPKVVGGRYGLGSKEFTPAMVKAAFDNLSQAKPKNHFVLGIVDDVSNTSLAHDPHFDTEDASTVRCLFYGLGSDGTVGANKNSIKIIGEDTDNFAQGYFVYDSKKSGAITISHLRFGPKPIESTYLISRANFVACHQWSFIDKYEMLENAVPGGVFLINSPFGPDEVWDELPREMQEQLLAKKLKLFVIDAYKVAKETGMGVRINTIMQTCFFAISGVLPREDAIAQIKTAIKKTYGKKGEEIVRMNFNAVDQTLANMYEVELPSAVTAQRGRPPIVPEQAPDFVQKVTAVMLAGKGDLLPVSAFLPDGTWPTATTKWEKRNVALEIPVWDPEVCIQCNKCILVCPHAAIRSKVYHPEETEKAPAGFKHATFKGAEFRGDAYTIQVAPEDCTGCGVCVAVCPSKNKANPKLKAINMAPQLPLLEAERKNYDFFLDLPEPDRSKFQKMTLKNSQFLLPLFEYSGACAGCGETPYIKLMSQLFGDRALIANATGCSSIYGGNLPTTPYCVDAKGRGPSWSNSLFEDAAEFGLGMRLAVDKETEFALELVKALAPQIGDTLARDLLTADQTTQEGIDAQRDRIVQLREALRTVDSKQARMLETLADYLAKKSVWIFGGDGWAYDIGYGGLDHVMASGRDVNILVMDTEVYSNTGGQQSKATPMGAVAKFAASGKPMAKKDLALRAIAYGSVYTARVAMGAGDAQTVKAFIEAESYPGPSLIIAYSHCIAHGYNLTQGPAQQKLAVQSGHWVMLRYDPRLAEKGEEPLQLDSKAPSVPLEDYIYNETRYRMLLKSNPERAKSLLEQAQQNVHSQWALYQRLAKAGANGANEEE
ncbi:MAG TPA: pyruvate:ferredoxin (flavodoxin) oxidoreductase, partial [Verrucomicrobia bacterium]|nr:pyruvate:ferredoxin (flavodoxin) oxidoreductase [Verrucomicrobiota bacterium]